MDSFAPLTFAWPWLLPLAGLPWLLRQQAARAESALRLPWSWGRELAPMRRPVVWGQRAQRRTAFVGMAWVFLVLAAARPQWQSLPSDELVRRHEILMAVDVSASMATRDLMLDGQQIDRLQAAKYLASQLAAHFPDARIGLLVFGQQVWLHTPLTWDHVAFVEAVESLRVGLAGQQTAVGDALVRALGEAKAVAGPPASVILITDGLGTAGAVTLGQAAWLAKRDGVRVHAIVVGASTSASPSLRDLASTTNGEYIRADDTRGLEAFSARLRRAPAPSEMRQTVSELQELYMWPMLLAYGILLFVLFRQDEFVSRAGRSIRS